MGIQKKTKDELKTKIFDTYAKYHEEPSSDRRKVNFGQLCTWVFMWCRGYIFFKKTEEIGEEIVKEVRRCAEKNKTQEEFLEDLLSSLYNKIKRYPGKENEVKDTLREPKIIKEFRKIIAWEEANEGRKLTNDERVNRIHRFIPMREKTIREHLECMDRNFDPVDNEGNDNIESVAGRSLTAQGTVSDPQNEAMEDSEAQIIKNALETVLNEYHDKMKPFYRALFTMRCIKENKNYRRLIPVFDGEILEMFKENRKIPAQYEIYMKYHPKAEKSTAEANASSMSKIFFANLEKEIKEKHPEIKF